MRVSPTLLAAVLSLACFAATARAEEPKSVTLSPEMKALLVELLKVVQATKSETAVVLDPEADAPSPKVAGPEVKQPMLSSVGSLRGGSLKTRGLEPSAGLGGRGTKGESSRPSAEEWRMLFPLRQDRR